MKNIVGVKNMLDSFYDPFFVVDDQEFRLYLHDHKQIILSGCTKVKLTPDQWARYQYRPRWFLRENRYPVQASWIFLWINDMVSNMDFINKDVLLIPNFTTLEELYNKYRTLKSRHINAMKLMIKK